MCYCKTTAGYQNLSKDFNVFLVGDATLATFPANSQPAVCHQRGDFVRLDRSLDHADLVDRVPAGTEVAQSELQPPGTMDRVAELNHDPENRMSRPLMLKFAPLAVAVMSAVCWLGARGADDARGAQARRELLAPRFSRQRAHAGTICRQEGGRAGLPRHRLSAGEALRAAAGRAGRPVGRQGRAVHRPSTPTRSTRRRS